MPFGNTTPDPLRGIRRLDEQRKETNRVNDRFQKTTKKWNDDAISTWQRLKKEKEAKNSEWKPKPDHRYDATHFGPPRSEGVQLFRPQAVHRQAPKPIDTGNDVGAPVTHHVKAVFVFLGCLALTFGFGILIGNILGGSFNAVFATWVIGFYITIGVTKSVWRKHD